ncbi:hypothetical protein PVA45_00210 [Entomospira entomophila]|uniref:DUF2764 family protein n=1 Tax=Entomospira entomophila TaxID=2719988 RepID=A0A968KT60_9SPIO|nr:hypothetical protein [Entomospira entomophilus]NIZ39946.1 hypothetical protein [Entomospira entomophilus]WDI35507.1 hypothetical protein PVA45_00210 [Entomospira entomophilus]
MANLYYLMASLPAIAVTDEQPRISYQDFLKQAHGAIGLPEYERLTAFNLQTIPVTLTSLGSLERKFWHWEIALRNELTLLRAKAFGVKPDAYLHKEVQVDSSDIKRIALQAFEESDPLQVELELNKGRWALLEAERPLDYFGITSLLIYSMQLQLITRRGLFNKELGEQNYQQAYELILGEAKTVLMENIR